MSARSDLHSALSLEVGPSFKGVVDHLLALTAKVNRLDEDVLTELGPQMLRTSSEVGTLQVQTTALVDQVNKLTDAVREMREALLPGASMRKELITLPNIIIEEVKHVIDEAELQKRRQESMRARAMGDEKSRDKKNAWLAFWGLLVASVVAEILRVIFEHHL